MAESVHHSAFYIVCAFRLWAVSKWDSLPALTGLSICSASKRFSTKSWRCYNLSPPQLSPFNNVQCSCQSSNGFGLFQQDPIESGSSSFHTILDIVCRNCTQKVPNLKHINSAYMEFYNHSAFPDKLWHLHNSWRICQRSARQARHRPSDWILLRTLGGRFKFGKKAQTEASPQQCGGLAGRGGRSSSGHHISRPGCSPSATSTFSREKVLFSLDWACLCHMRKTFQKSLQLKTTC